MKARRYWLMAVVALLFSMAAEAVPVRPGQWITVTLADGTTVSVEARGDEYSSWWRDAQGRCYVRQGDTFVMTDLKTINASAVPFRIGPAVRHVAPFVHRLSTDWETEDGVPKAASTVLASGKYRC